MFEGFRKPGFRTAANDNFEEIKRTEASPLIDPIKIRDIRQTIEQARETQTSPYLWGDVKLHDMRIQISGYSLVDAIHQINTASAEQVLERPTYYLALLDLIDEHHTTIQDEE